MSRCGTYSVQSTRYILQPRRCQRLLNYSIASARYGSPRKSGVSTPNRQSARHLPPHNFPRGKAFLTYV